MQVVRADVFEDFNGRSKGCAVVVYKDEQSAKRAIVELTDSRLQGAPWCSARNPLELRRRAFYKSLLCSLRHSDRPIFVREDREEGSKVPGSGGR